MDSIKPHLAKINGFLEKERAVGKVIFPEPENIFRALELTH